MKKKNKLMKAFSVAGVSTSGKTTLVELIVSELTKRGYTVGTVKSIGHGRYVDSNKDDKENLFTIDTKGKNSYRHRQAGAKQTSTWAKGETAIIYQSRLKLHEIIENYDFDYLIIEGGKDYSLPRITTGINIENTLKNLVPTTFAISGKVSEETDSLKNIKVFKTFEDLDELVDLIEEKVFPVIGFRDEIGCNLCGMSCKELNFEILKGNKSFKDCINEYPKISGNIKDNDLEKLRKALSKVNLEGFKGKIKIEI